MYYSLAIRFGETDVLLREGGAVRQVGVQRVELSASLGIKVYAATIKRYQQRNWTMHGCNLTLEDLNIDERQVDPAEGLQ